MQTSGHLKGIVLRGIVCVGLLTSMAAIASAAESKAIDPGRALYDQYCASCHGLDGKGDGPVAKFMTSKPTDLTQMAKKAGGDFPTLRVMRVIDGTQIIAAHGDSKMPVWGQVLRQEATSIISRRAEAYGKLMLITDYIRSIQVK